MPRTMRAVVKAAAAPGAELQHVDVPVPGPRDVLVRVQATTVCGTDLHIYDWDAWAQERTRPPLIAGHEFSGEVVAVGSEVDNLVPGDRVAAETHVVCGTCRACREGQAHVCRRTVILGVDTSGSYAEYVRLPAGNGIKIPESMDPVVASLLEPFGNAVHTVLSGPVAGRTVLVMGCGPIGIMACAVAAAAGAAAVFAVDINPYRLEFARRMGATHTILSTEEDPVAAIRRATGGEGADVVCEMSGHPVAIRQAFEALAYAGRFSMLGLPSKPVELDIANGIVFKGATVHGIAGRRMYETWSQAMGLVGSGRVDLAQLVTHRLPLDAFDEAMSLMRSGSCGKVALLP
ncbi:MAG: L-threonine 3-dehydrogenase [Candidatus Sericytochromatia bacterium]|nr:L-threonine 3-dehydrogenase [Candidatus Sericytochromatia bacterium]